MSAREVGRTAEMAETWIVSEVSCAGGSGGEGEQGRPGEVESREYGKGQGSRGQGRVEARLGVGFGRARYASPACVLHAIGRTVTCATFRLAAKSGGTEYGVRRGRSTLQSACIVVYREEHSHDDSPLASLPSATCSTATWVRW